jgi:hypothetical protein
MTVNILSVSIKTILSHSDVYKLMMMMPFICSCTQPINIEV